MEYTIKDIIGVFKKHLFLIFLCTLFCACAIYLFSRFVIQPQYTASVQMYVDPNEASTSLADLNELTYAQKVVTTYINFLKTKTFYRQVHEQCNLPYTQGELSDMINILIVSNTEIFRINVTSPNPQDSYKIAEAIQKLVPELIKSIKKKTEISIVDPAVMPTSPSSPNIMKNTMIGGVLGFILSILASFIWVMTDIHIKSGDDLQKKYQLPVLGTIPDFNSHRKGYKIKSSFTLRKPSSTINMLGENTRFAIIEAYKALRMNLRFVLRSEGCKKILMISPEQGEGKSTTCVNLGITISQTGAKVLLIDCDLRNGILHRYFGLSGKSGVSDILSRMYELEAAVVDTSYENLKVIPMGSLPPNPMELLASSEMEKLIKKLEKEYDYIIIDTPPVNIVSDSLGLAKLVDGALLVVREKTTSYPNIANVIMKYKFAQMNIYGFIYNGAYGDNDRKSKYYYNYGHKLD